MEQVYGVAGARKLPRKDRLAFQARQRRAGGAEVRQQFTLQQGDGSSGAGGTETRYERVSGGLYVRASAPRRRRSGGRGSPPRPGAVVGNPLEAAAAASKLAPPGHFSYVESRTVSFNPDDSKVDSDRPGTPPRPDSPPRASDVREAPASPAKPLPRQEKAWLASAERDAAESYHRVRVHSRAMGPLQLPMAATGLGSTPEAPLLELRSKKDAALDIKRWKLIAEGAKRRAARTRSGMGSDNGALDINRPTVASRKRQEAISAARARAESQPKRAGVKRRRKPMYALDAELFCSDEEEEGMEENKEEEEEEFLGSLPLYAGTMGREAERLCGVGALEKYDLWSERRRKEMVEEEEDEEEEEGMFWWRGEVKCPPLWRLAMGAYVEAVKVRGLDELRLKFTAWRDHAKTRRRLRLAGVAVRRARERRVAEYRVRWWRRAAKWAGMRRAMGTRRTLRKWRETAVRMRRARQIVDYGAEFFRLKALATGLARFAAWRKTRASARLVASAADAHFARAARRRATVRWRAFAAAAAAKRRVDALADGLWLRRGGKIILRAWKNAAKRRRRIRARAEIRGRARAAAAFAILRAHTRTARAQRLQLRAGAAAANVAARARAIRTWRDFARARRLDRAASAWAPVLRTARALRIWRRTAARSSHTNKAEECVRASRWLRLCAAAMGHWRRARAHRALERSEAQEAMAVRTRAFLRRWVRRAAEAQRSRLRALAAGQYLRKMQQRRGFLALKGAVAFGVVARKSEKLRLRRAVRIWRTDVAKELGRRRAAAAAEGMRLTSALASSIRVWRRRTRVRKWVRDATVVAGVFRERVLCGRALEQWTNLALERRERRRAAAKWRAAHTIRRVRQSLRALHWWAFRWDHLAVAIQRRQRARHFAAWRQFTGESQRQKQWLQAMSRVTNQRLLTTTFRAWTTHTETSIAHKVALEAATSWHHRSLLQKTFHRWHHYRRPTPSKATLAANEATTIRSSTRPQRHRLVPSPPITASRAAPVDLPPDSNILDSLPHLPPSPPSSTPSPESTPSPNPPPRFPYRGNQVLRNVRP